MRRKNLLTGYRMFFAFLGFSAVVTEIATLHERDKLIPSNFFSFFTIESNLLAVVILIVSAFALTAGLHKVSIAMLRGSNTVNMIVVGVTFSLLLSGMTNVEFTAVPWDNTVLHYIMPVVVAFDWLVDVPTESIPFRRALIWLAFPIAYLVYTLIRGHYVGWYPYPFLNPTEHGYIGVTIASTGLALGAAALVCALTWSTGRAAGAKMM